MDVDDQPRWVWEPERRVVAHIGDIEHHADHVAGELRCADPLQKAPVRHGNRLAGQVRSKPGAMQVKEDAGRVGNARGFKWNLVLVIPPSVAFWRSTATRV